MDPLVAEENRFGGIVAAPESLPAEPQEFRERLAVSVRTWKELGCRVAWLEIPIGKSALIPVATAAGFGFHHTAESYLMMTCRLEQDAFVPPFATHYIGAGGVVINAHRELLVVCERHRRSDRPYFKLPGGAIHPGEHIAAGVMREIFEETGVRTEFDALVCFRHWHGYRYDKSDIYFICRLHPLTEEISKQDEEIEECRWMPISKYLESDYVGTFNRQIVKAAMDSHGIVQTFVEGYSEPDRHEIFMPTTSQEPEPEPVSGP